MSQSYSQDHLARISLVPFRTFRRPLFSKPVTGQELFFAISYSKPALVGLGYIQSYSNHYERPFRLCFKSAVILLLLRSEFSSISYSFISSKDSLINVLIQMIILVATTCIIPTLKMARKNT